MDNSLSPTVIALLSSFLILICIAFPYIHIRLVFVPFNGVFSKAWKQNKIAVHREWSATKRALLLNFWDKRVYPQFWLWYVLYLGYLLQITLFAFFQVNAHRSNLFTRDPQKYNGLTALMAIGCLIIFFALTSIAFKITRLPRLRKKKTDVVGKGQSRKSKIGYWIIVCILIAFIICCGCYALLLVK